MNVRFVFFWYWIGPSCKEGNLNHPQNWASFALLCRSVINFSWYCLVWPWAVRVDICPICGFWVASCCSKFDAQKILSCQLYELGGSYISLSNCLSESRPCSCQNAFGGCLKCQWVGLFQSCTLKEKDVSVMEQMWGEWAACTDGTSGRGGYALSGQDRVFGLGGGSGKRM